MQKQYADNIKNTSQTVWIIDKQKTASIAYDKQVKAIGSLDVYTDAYGAAIEACKKAYAALSDSEQQLVLTNETLATYEQNYKTKTAERAKEVDDKIARILYVSLERKSYIQECENAYNALSKDQKALIENKDILDSAVEILAQLEKEAADKKKEVKLPEKTPEKSQNNSGDASDTTTQIGTTKIQKLKNVKKKSVQIAWQKDTSCSGYEVAWSTDKKFKKAKHHRYIKSNKQTKTKITKLKRRKTYYFRIREYVMKNGKKVFGKWSETKKAKIK